MHLDLQVKATEAHEKALAYFKVAEQYGYKFIMEVKEIRDNQYYKSLGFSSFDEYCEKSWNIKRDFMDQRIEVAVSIGNERQFADTYRQLGHSKSLILARMQPEIRKQIETNHDVNDLTVKKLKEVERKLKEQTEILESTKASAEHWQKLAKQAQSLPPRIETRTVEVVPDRIKKELKEKEEQIAILRNGYQETKEKLKQFEMKSTDDFDAEQAETQRKKLQHEADLNTVRVRIAYKDFVEKAAIGSFLHGAIAVASDAEKKRLTEFVELAEQIIEQTKMALRGRKIGEI